MTFRKEYGFEIDAHGHLVYSPKNIELARRLFIDWEIIQGDGGPGAVHDGKGTWHVFCHLAAAAVIYRIPRGAMWLGIIYNSMSKRCEPAFCVARGGQSEITHLDSSEGRELLAVAEWVGYVEGASRGHVLDRTANDPGDPDIDDRRQDYDQVAGSTADGGPVWEHWTTSRDIIGKNGYGSQVLSSFVAIVAAVGGRFAGTVARGRSDSEYGHLRHMCAMVRAGMIAPEDITWDVAPRPIPPDIESILLEATPAAFSTSAARLEATCEAGQYWMYQRKIDSFFTVSLGECIASNWPGSPAISDQGVPYNRANAKAARNT